MDRAGRLGRRVARDPARKRELAEKLADSLLIRADVRVELAIGAFEPCVRDDGRAAVSGPCDVDRVEVSLPDRAVQVDVDQVEARNGSEVAEEPRLDVLARERLTQERVVEQVDLADGQVVRRSPVRVDEPQLARRKRLLGQSRHSLDTTPRAAGEARARRRRQFPPVRPAQRRSSPHARPGRARGTCRRSSRAATTTHLHSQPRARRRW